MYNLFQVYPKHVAVDDDLFDQMYYHAGPWKAMGYNQKVEYGVVMDSTMTDNIHSKLIVWVDTTGFNAAAPAERYTDCSYHPVCILTGKKTETATGVEMQIQPYLIQTIINTHCFMTDGRRELLVGVSPVICWKIIIINLINAVGKG